LLFRGDLKEALRMAASHGTPRRAMAGCGGKQRAYALTR